MNNRYALLHSLRAVFLCLTFSLGTLPLVADVSQGLVLHYDFQAADGTTITDKSASGIDATLRNGAAIDVMGDWALLNLGQSGGFLDMTAKAGALFRTLDNYTISMYYRVNKATSLSGNGHFLWAFSTTVSSPDSESIS